MPRTIREIPSLNGLRAVAVALVFWGHSGLRTLVTGSSGVTIFFLISGYLITTLMLREQATTGRLSIRDFYLRRVLRIFPPLYITIAAAVVISLAGWLANAMTGWGLVSTLTYWTNYYIIGSGRGGLPAPMEALWSLAVEEHYYLLFPVVFIALHRFARTAGVRAVVLTLVCLLALAWRVVLDHHGATYDRIYLATDTRLDSILWGAVLALLASPERLQDRLASRPLLADALVVAGAIVFYAAQRGPGGTSLTFSFTVESLALFPVFAGLIGAPRSLTARLMNWRPIAWVGLVSYSVYLLHRPALELAARLPGPLIVSVCVAGVVTLLLAEAMRRLVETPCAGLRRRLSHSGRHEEIPVLSR